MGADLSYDRAAYRTFPNQRLAPDWFLQILLAFDLV
jgi:hypothetical protein